MNNFIVHLSLKYVKDQVMGVRTVLVLFIVVIVLQSCVSGRGKSCKPARKRYFSTTFLNM